MFYDWEFRFRDLGPVRDATLKLGDLTIITGRNNTGKTYMVYTLYGFLRDFSDMAFEVMGDWSASGKFSYSILFPSSEFVRQLLDDGVVRLYVPWDKLLEDKVQLIKQVCRVYSHYKIDNVFGARPGTFRDSVFDVETGQEGVSYPPLSFDAPVGNLSIYPREDGLTITFESDRKERTSVVAGERLMGMLLEKHLQEAYIQFLFYDAPFLSWFNRPHCSTSSRLAISLFYPELESSKRLSLRRLQQEAEVVEGQDEALQVPADILRGATSRYALPIDDEIDFVKSIPDIDREWGFPSPGGVLDDMESLTGGRYTKTDGTLYFVPTRGEPDRLKIPLHLASSSSVEMSKLYFYFLIEFGEKDRLLIIDEPESHLDPINQMRLARAIVRHVNSGGKILISTHSDYIVKEINNLIMLNGSFDDKEGLLRKLEYEEGDAIDPAKIRAYHAVDGELKECSMNAFGIEVPTFENSIDKLVRVSGVLGSRMILEEGEDE